MAAENPNKQGCCLTIFQGAQKGKSQKVGSPTGNVLGAAAKIFGAQRTFLGAPCCWAPVRQQPWNKSKLNTYASTRKNTFTLVTLQSFSISGVISAEKMYVENWQIYRRLYDCGYALNPQLYKRLHFSIFNVHFLSWYYTWNAETLQSYQSKGVLSSAGIRF